MSVTLASAKYRERGGRDSLERAGVWQSNALVLFGLSSALGACGAAIATTTTKVKSVNATAYRVGGQQYTKAGTDNLWTLSGSVVPASSFQKYALMIDDAGAATVQEATPSQASAAAVTWENVVAAAKTNPKNPYAALISLLNGSRAIFATLTIATNASTTFTPGTTALGAAGIAATYTDGIDPALLPLLANGTGLIHGLQV